MTPFVLFVDDEPDNLAVFEACCADAFEVLTATSAEDALALMRTHEVAVILADQRMPETSGLELLEICQQEFPQSVRMLITAYSDLDTAIDAINRGRVRWYLKKPWDNRELIATISEALDLYLTRAKMRALEERLLEAERVYSLGVIASGLAREVRRPINLVQHSINKVSEAIHAASGLLSDAAGPSTVARMRLFEAKEELRDALENLDRVLDTVRGLEVPGHEHSDELVDLTEVLRLTLRVLQAQVRSSTSFEFDVHPVALVRGSSTQLAHVILNLLVNAFRAMQGRPRSKSSLVLRLSQADDWVVLEIADSGPGIDPDVLPHVFDPFHEGSHDRATGLGLAITRAIVAELGGSIEASNRSEGGAAFTVRLPAAVAADGTMYRPMVSTIPLSGAQRRVS
jgi:signal transduction histidine kinase